MLLGEPRVTRVTTGLVPEDKPREDEVEDAEDSSFWDSPSRATVKGHFQDFLVDHETKWTISVTIFFHCGAIKIRRSPSRQNLLASLKQQSKMSQLKSKNTLYLSFQT